MSRVGSYLYRRLLYRNIDNLGIMKIDSPYPDGTIDPRISSTILDNGNGLQCHVLQAGNPDHPCVLLLHGFPELAYSWRKVMVPLAEAGFHVLAPDQRGYGQTTGSDNSFAGDVGSFRLFNLVRDVIGLVFAAGHQSVHAVVGHDFGSAVAAWCAVIRPDIFRAVVLMSAPFGGTPKSIVSQTQTGITGIDHAALSTLTPPRKHYQWYYSTAVADTDMRFCKQGLHDFLRAYYHQKSADWTANKPHVLDSWDAGELAKLPTYYVMHEHLGMAETVAREMPDQQSIDACEWLSDTELAVYTAAYEAAGFQGGLNWYRCITSGDYIGELQTFSGLTIDVPSMFISGASDWGVYQKPGEFQAMQDEACKDLRGCHLINGAGHWVQQEQAVKVTQLFMAFLETSTR